jgi:hypothetical protein
MNKREVKVRRLAAPGFGFIRKAMVLGGSIELVNATGTSPRRK